MANVCEKCGCEFVFLKHYISSKPNPVEVKPAANGNLVIDRVKGIYRMATLDDKVLAKETGKHLYRSHFAECPAARSFRRK